MSETIKLEYESIIQAASKFDGLSAEVLDEAKKIYSLKDSVSLAWKGESGDKVQQIYTEWGAVQKTIGDSLKSIAERMRTTAEAIKAADEEAASNINGC